MKLRTLKRRYGRRPPTEPSWLLGLKWTRAERRALMKRQPLPIQFNTPIGQFDRVQMVVSSRLRADPYERVPMQDGEIARLDLGYGVLVLKSGAPGAL